MKLSQLRLENTRFFDDVNLSDQDTNIPGRRNLRVAVREGRTGNLTFGAGFSSLERATLFAEVSQSNFDFMNRRSFFQGDGQKFRLRMQLGSLSSQIVLNFEEPWLFDRQLAVGFSVFRTTSEYTSSVYNQIETGFEVYARKHLFELVAGRLSYTYEIFNITDITPNASPIIQQLAGENAASRIGLQLERDRVAIRLRAAARLLLHAAHLIRRAHQLLNVMAHFVCDHIGLREIARRAEPRLKLLEELQVEIDLPVERTIERPHRGLSGAASRACRLVVEHESRRLVALELARPHIGRR